MALVLADRVLETTSVAGTGNATLGGAQANYQAFSVVGDGSTTYYTIVDNTNNEWEVGVGTYVSAGNYISRDTVLSSSNAGALVYFGSGTKDIFCDLPAEKVATLGALSYQGTWNASTNVPTLASGVGTQGYYYVVSVAGSTNLDGITDWKVNDYAIYNGTAWQKIDNTDAVTSVNGQTGVVVLTASDVGAQPAGTYVTSVGATSPVTSSGGTTPTIAMPSATTSVSGYLTSTDWNTFNGKAPATSGTNILYGNGAGGFSNVTVGSGLTFTGGTLAASGGASGDVVGPASATDNAIARYDTTTGKLIQSSGVIIDDSNNVTGVNTLTATNIIVNDDTTLGGSNADSLTVNARITTDLEPATNNAKDIGTSGRNWRDGFFGRNLGTVNLSVTGTTSFDGSEGTSGQVLTSAGTGNTPTWTTPTTGTVTSVSGTAPIASTGGATPAISISQATTSTDGYLSSTDWNTFNNKGSGTVTSVTGTAPVVSSGGATPAISMAAATTSVNGYLTSTDWNTFNGKYSTGGALGTPSSGTLTNCTGYTYANLSGTVPTWNQDTTGKSAKTDALNSATTVVNVSSSTAPTAGQVLTATSGTAATWQSPGGGFPSGTAMLFVQTSAPTGWTKSTAHDNKALRIVSGTAGTGGSVAFTTAFASQAVTGSISVTVGAGTLAVGAGTFAVGATTISTAQMPSHTHTIPVISSSPGGSAAGPSGSGTMASGATGGGGSHTHSLTGAPTISGSPSVTSSSFTGNAINLAVQYVDVIIATKD